MAEITEFQIMMDALIEIAAYDDHGANEALARKGSYSSFDEPGSVEIARVALSKLNRLAVSSKEKIAWREAGRANG